MNTGKTLVIMAAGLASRYGGGKQTASFGPNGEMLMEYSIFDAKNAGFERVIIIVSKAMSEQFREDILRNVSGIDVLFATQCFENLPEWFTLPEGRVKPYGTTHAVLSAGHLLDGPFVIINADDYYGFQAMSDISAMLDRLPEAGEGCTVTYPLVNTVSVFGSVTRGICHVSDNGGFLECVTETRSISAAEDGRILIANSDGTHTEIAPDTPVSMNIFGFTPSILPMLEELFYGALRAGTDTPLTDEYPIPVFIDKLISSGRLRIHTRPTQSEWFGVTYPQDAESVKQKLCGRPSPRV